MSTPPKYFKRQSGEMVAVTQDLESLIKEANEILQTVRTTMPPPAFEGMSEDDIPTVPPPPLPMTPVQEDGVPEEEARPVYSIVRVPRPMLRPLVPKKK